MDVTLLYFDGCPNWELADRRLRDLRDELGFRGSPTVLVDGDFGGVTLDINGESRVFADGDQV